MYRDLDFCLLAPILDRREERIREGITEWREWLVKLPFSSSRSFLTSGENAHAWKNGWNIRKIVFHPSDHLVHSPRLCIQTSCTWTSSKLPGVLNSVTRARIHVLVHVFILYHFPQCPLPPWSDLQGLSSISRSNYQKQNRPYNTTSEALAFSIQKQPTIAGSHLFIPCLL